MSMSDGEGGGGGYVLSAFVHAGILSLVVFGVPKILLRQVPTPMPPVAVQIVSSADMPILQSPTPLPLARRSGTPVAAPATEPVPSEPAVVAPPATGLKNVAAAGASDQATWQPAEKPDDRLSRPLPPQPLQQSASVTPFAPSETAAAPPVAPTQAVETTDDTHRDPQSQAASVTALSTQSEFDAVVKSLIPPTSMSNRAKDRPSRLARRNAPAGGAAEPEQPAPDLALSAAEVDAVRSQVERCWNYSGDAQSMGGITVPIRLILRRDGTVVSARIVDRGGHDDDPLWQTVADSAVRALRSPSCNPLSLPPEKYAAWHNATFNFSP